MEKESRDGEEHGDGVGFEWRIGPSLVLHSNEVEQSRNDEDLAPLVSDYCMNAVNFRSCTFGLGLLMLKDSRMDYSMNDVNFRSCTFGLGPPALSTLDLAPQ
ncbi:hypothetical protein NL676_038051 [Syzygium grande]|nr:hypothetical protein NL676_038051 [Syzygium grande]